MEGDSSVVYVILTLLPFAIFGVIVYKIAKKQEKKYRKLYGKHCMYCDDSFNDYYKNDDPYSYDRYAETGYGFGSLKDDAFTRHYKDR